MTLHPYLKTKTLPIRDTLPYFQKNFQLRTYLLCIPLINGNLKMSLFNYYSKKNLNTIVKSMSPPIFDPITFNQLPQLMNTKNPPCLNGDKVELSTNLLRVFNHKHRFAIVNKLLDKGGMDTTRLAASLRLQESYILEHLLVLQRTGMVHSIDVLDGVKFVANKRAIRKVNEALRSFSQN
jgi:hypothetical protein